MWLAFTAAAATSPNLLRRAQAAGDLDPGIDVDVEAALLLAVIDGLVLQALALPAAERAEVLLGGLDTHLSRLFTDANGGGR